MVCRCSGSTGSANGTCNCEITAGPGIDVYGTGVDGDPYVVTLVAAPSRWWDGEGPPDPEPEDSQAGDYYLDTVSGDVWRLAGEDSSGGAVLIGNIVGPEGPQGEQGIQGEQGPQGDPGTGVNIVGSVPTSADLPTDLGPDDAGSGYMADDTGHLWVWSGAAWTDAGEIRGPEGPQGPPGPSGQLLELVVFREPGTYSFAKADYPDATRCRVRGIGGGGGGGSAGAGSGASGVASIGGGGGGGGYFEKWFLMADLDETTVVTVGSGGTPAEQADLSTGGKGGTTTFADCSALGGNGGTSSTNRADEGHVANRGAGDGATAPGGITIAGSDGTNGIPYDSGRRYSPGQGGAAASMSGSVSNGTGGVNSRLAGPDGRLGGGGGGAVVGRDVVTAGVFGGSGGPGAVLIEVFS
jgi:hypothetical protein